MPTYDVKYLLVLLHAFCSHSRTAYRVFNAFPEYEILLAQGDEPLQKLGITVEQIADLRKPNWPVIEKELHWATQKNQYLIAFVDDAYPRLLREIHDPPLVLFAQGDKSILSTMQLAIVGSRNPTPIGTDNAFIVAKDLATVGWCVTSGLALGIDAAAHRGALAGQGKTIAVMGAGFNHIYPMRHKKLAEEIVGAGGVLLSEFPLMCAPLAENFPQRNRIISGLSLGVIVVEATLRSGSLITARFAGEQGREVFAFPGSVHNPLSRGCHELIRQGAKLIENVQDVLVELPENNTNAIADNTCKKTANPHINITAVDKKVLHALDDSATSLDVIASRSSLTIKEIMSILVHLELRGLVQKVSGGYIKR